MCTTLALTGNARSVLKRSCPLASRRVYPVCIGGKRAAPPEDCRGAWGYMERLDQHRLYPPLEAMQVVADAISTLLEADPQTSVRAALGDLDDLREAVDCLEGYQAFQPDHFDRGEINTTTALPGVAGGERAMKVKVQVVTITDDGQEITQDVACVERHDLTPVTFGLSLAEGKAVLQALQEVVVEWQMHAYLQPATRLSAVWQGAPQQGPPSHGVSHRLWGAPG